MKNNKILNILIAVIAVIGGFLFIRIFMVEDAEAFKTDVDLQNGVISPIIYFSTFLFIAAVVIALVLSLWSMIRNPENLKKTLLGIAVLAVVLVGAYFMADDNAVLDTTGAVLEGGEAGTATNKWVGTGIYYSIALGLVASAFFVYDLLKGLVKS